MPTFDIVSEVDKHELTNAVDQASREVNQRFDLKGTAAKFDLEGADAILVTGESEFQINQLVDLLHNKMVKRGIDSKCLDAGDFVESGMTVKQRLEIKQGIDKELAKKIGKQIKEMKIKVQSTVQEEQVRVSGKKRDDLQQVIAHFKEQDFGIPLQFKNFRD